MVPYHGCHDNAYAFLIINVPMSDTCIGCKTRPKFQYFYVKLYEVVVSLDYLTALLELQFVF